jgi:hypothetical protein
MKQNWQKTKNDLIDDIERWFKTRSGPLNARYREALAHMTRAELHLVEDLCARARGCR